MANPVSSGVSPAKLPLMSGFDKSFKNLLTAKVGTLVPVLCDPLIPGSRVNLSDAFRVTMPPLASDTFMDLDLKLEAFFVPAQACYGGFNDFITKRVVMDKNGDRTRAVLPKFSLNYDNDALNLNTLNRIFANGSLADYLGVKNSMLFNADYMPNLNPLPFIAYQRIYDRFYRNSLVTNPLFSKVDIMAGPYAGANKSCANLPYVVLTENDAELETTISYISTVGHWMPYIGFSSTDQGEQVTGYNDIFALRQRNFGADYFTTATPSPQMGDPAAVEFKVDLTSGEGSVSIAAIRAINALQIFRERNNMSSDDIHSYNRAHYGVNKTGYGESLPQFLGSSSTPVVTRGIDQTAGMDSETRNPFKTVGAQYGQADANAQTHLVDGFEAPEYGYLMVLASLVPKAAYSTGIARHLLEMVNGNGVADIPDAILQQVGPQPIYKFELDGTQLGQGADLWDAEFGYQQRFAHYMDKMDEVHGLFVDGGSLESFALQRGFVTNVPTISTDFLKIPTDFLDQVSAVESGISEFGYWMDIYFDYKVAMPLAAYSIPSLENPAGNLEWLPKPGYKLR